MHWLEVNSKTQLDAVQTTGTPDGVVILVIHVKNYMDHNTAICGKVRHDSLTSSSLYMPNELFTYILRSWLNDKEWHNLAGIDLKWW